MQKTSYNVIFVYSLLVVDLLVNIADKLVPSTHTDPISRHREINKTAFLIVLVQIIAIFCVIADLVLHFFDASDQVRQFAWENHSKIKNDNKLFQVNPMPQRIALKLVLDKYWWSLLVGVSYLVVTIILQIVRLDPSWHYNALNSNLQMSSPIEEIPKENKMFDELKMDINEQTIPAEGSVLISEVRVPNGAGKAGYDNDDYSTSDVQAATDSSNLLPIVVLIIHKLMSTCYYVSFVVVYRATPSQILSRIFVNQKSFLAATTTATTINDKQL